MTTHDSAPHPDGTGSTDTGTGAWWVSRDGGQLGPFTRDQLAERVRTGELRSDTLVWRDGQSGWKEARATELAGLWGIETKTEPPPPPPPGSTTAALPPPGPAAPGPAASSVSSRSSTRDDDDRPSNAWAWALVTAPLILVIVDVVIVVSGGDPGSPGAWIPALAVNGFFAWMDHRTLERAGYESPGLGWAILVVPVYLFKRARLLGTDQRIFAAWIVAFIVSLLPISSDIAGDVVGVEVDAARVEDAIEDDIRDQFGVRARVDCPSGIPLKRGERFRCIADDGMDRIIVRVEVENRAGDITWEYG